MQISLHPPAYWREPSSRASHRNSSTPPPFSPPAKYCPGKAKAVEHIILMLSQNPRGLTHSDLIAKLNGKVEGMTRSGLTRIIGDLKAKGFVECSRRAVFKISGEYRSWQKEDFTAVVNKLMFTPVD
jgi:hypothetical protein